MNQLSKENSIFIKRNKRRTVTRYAVIVLLVCVILFALFMLNDRLLNWNRGGNDFLVNWVSARIVLEGGSPYTDEAANKIFEVQKNYADPPYNDEVRMAYPLYTVLLFLPFSFIEDYALALTLWRTLLQLGVIVMALLSLKLVDWRPTPLLLIAYVAFCVIGLHSVQAFYKGDVAILLSVMLVMALLVLKNGQEELSGVLLSFLMIKPQLAFLPVIFLFIWLIRQGRWKTMFWFFAITGILIGLGFVVIPDWLIQYTRVLIAFKGSHPIGNIVEATAAVIPSFGERLGWVVTAVISFIMVIEWFLSNDKSFNRLIWVFSFSLVVNQWVNLYTDAGNFVILLPVFALVLSTFNKRWKKLGSVITFMLAVLLFVSIWSVPSWGPITSMIIQPRIALYLILPGFLLVTLYWIRWWVATPDIWLEQFTPYKS